MYNNSSLEDVICVPLALMHLSACPIARQRSLVTCKTLMDTNTCTVSVTHIHSIDVQHHSLCSLVLSSLSLAAQLGSSLQGSHASHQPGQGQHRFNYHYRMGAHLPV